MSSPRARMDGIEWVRVVSACGVVWFHIQGGPFKEYGHAGLICFVLISTFFQAMGADRDPFAKYTVKRLRRILPPWFFWFGFYGLFNLAKGKHLFPSSEGMLADVLTGPWLGLWFFPFILVMSLLVFGFVRMTAKWHPYFVAAVYCIIGVSMMAEYPHLEKLRLQTVPWAQWTHALPAVPIGMGFYALWKCTVKSKWIALGLFLTIIEVMCLILWKYSRDFAICHGLASLVFCLGLAAPFRLIPIVTQLGGLCLGVYVLHSAVITVLKLLPVAGSISLFLFMGALVISFSGVWLMKKNSLAAKVL